MKYQFDYAIIEAINNAIRTVKAAPLMLGATSSGYGGPPGGYVGYLPQSRISFDGQENSVWPLPASGLTLLDNLNRIRYRLGVLESGGGGGSGGASSFLELSDTPDSYSGEVGKVLVVNATEDGLEFAVMSGGGGGGTWGSITGTISDQTDLQAELDLKLNNSGHTAARIPYTDGSGNMVITDSLVFNEEDGALVIGDNGTDSPPLLGTLNPTGNPTGFIFTNIGGTVGVQLKGIGVNGSNTSPTVVASGRRLVSLRGAGYDGVTAIKDSLTSAEIRVVADEDFDSSGHGTKIEMWVTPVDSTTIIKALTVRSDGNVDIASGKQYLIDGYPALMTYSGVHFMYPFASYINISPLTATNSYPFSSTLPSFTTHPKQYSQAVFIAAGTNNTSNYWTLELRDAGTGTLIASVTTYGLAANAGYTLTDTTMGLSSLDQATHKYLYLIAIKTGTPANLNVHAPAVEYTLE